MRKFAGRVIHFIRQDGPTPVEGVVLMALIIIVCITAVAAMRSSENTTFTNRDKVVEGTAS
jgi:hypothetical protein